MNYFYTHHQAVLSRILNHQTGLYPHQRDALLALYQKAMRGEMTASCRQAALILAGVGTGKTLMQLLTPFVLAPWMMGKQVLFLSDNCTLRDRILREFPTDPQGHAHYQQWPLYQLHILPLTTPPPTLVSLDATHFNNYAYSMHCADILVGNRQFVINLVNRGDIDPQNLGLLIIDEAHFSAAASYRTITQYFQNALLTYFTGSKFRSDSQPLPHIQYQEVPDQDDQGNPLIRYSPIADYEFSLQQAWKLDPTPIKKLTLQEATSEAFLIEEDGKEIFYPPETFFQKAEIDRLWFRKILFADSFSLPVLQKAVEILLNKRETSQQPHAMLVRALNIAHTHRVAKLLEENFPLLQNRVGIIHSDHDSYDLAGRPSDILQRYYNGDLWVLVHCGMVGVGFDHPYASVSCCLCILKSLSPAEQEWGRIIRRLPGESPGYFPQLHHPNWGVVVTHESLQIRPLFEQFLQGVNSDTLQELPPAHPIPILVSEYEAGETVLTLSDTTAIQPGDTLQLSASVEWVQDSPLTPNLEPIEGERVAGASIAPLQLHEPEIAYNQEKIIDKITENLHRLRQQQTYHIQVEAILDTKRVQITPIRTDIPRGTKVKRERNPQTLPDAHFVSHVNLDWQVMVGNELLSYPEYKKREVLQQKGLSLDEDGDIIANGVKLRDTLPPAAYELFLKGLETELNQTTITPPPANIVARPDKAKLETQSRYGAQVRSLIYELFRHRRLIPDGVNGTSLLESSIEVLVKERERIKAKGEEIKFKNNQQFLHSAVFAHIKEETGRSWSEHTEEQYREAYRLARVYVMQLQEALKWGR